MSAEAGNTTHAYRALTAVERILGNRPTRFWAGQTVRCRYEEGRSCRWVERQDGSLWTGESVSPRRAGGPRAVPPACACACLPCRSRHLACRLPG